MNHSKTYQDIKTLFAFSKPLIEDTKPGEDYFDHALLMQAFERVKKDFDDDCARMEDIRDFVFFDTVDDFGARVTEIFSKWENEKGGPSLTSMVAAAIVHFDLDIERANVKSAFIGSILAEYPNDLLYHGNEHYRKVLLHTLKLIAVHNGMFGGMNRQLTKDHIAILLCCSCVHDLGHQGGDNLRDGVYTPGQLEKFAVDLVRPYLEAAGMDKDEFGQLETLVFCTDITFFAGDNSPCIRMKKIYKHYFWDDDRDDISMMMMGKLRRFEDNPRLVLMAMLLHEADIASSAGLSYEQTIKETIAIMEERGITTAGPKTVIAFLREQLGETMFTEASKRLYGQVMRDVIKQAEDDIERGRETYYEA